MAKHKTLGQVFTPTWIIAEILDLVGYKGESILDKYIIEPSSGDGAFLVEIVNLGIFKNSIDIQVIFIGIIRPIIE